MRFGPVAPASRWNRTTRPRLSRNSAALADSIVASPTLVAEGLRAQADRWRAKKPSTFSQPSIAASGRYIGVW